jgi:hypothetical protein
LEHPAYEWGSLDRHSEALGQHVVEELNATVQWWLLTEEITKGGKTWNNRGHVAALYQDELYEVRGGQSRWSALKDFGIYAGFDRIVIYVEPHNVLKANTPRTALILKGNQPIDYAEIGAAFVDKMPSELAAFMAGQVSAERGDHRKSIKKSLKEIAEALQQARYRRARRGKPDHFDVEEGQLRPRPVNQSRPDHPETAPPDLRMRPIESAVSTCEGLAKNANAGCEARRSSPIRRQKSSGTKKV